MISKLPPDSLTKRLWNFNDASGQTYMIKVPVDQPVITTTLNWKAGDRDEVLLVGNYCFDLPKLEAAGYIRFAGTKHYQLRFLNTNGRIELALNRETIALDIGPIPLRSTNLVPAGMADESSSTEEMRREIDLGNPEPNASSPLFTLNTTLKEIADALNRRAPVYDIGQLQHVRKEMKGMGRRAPGPIFSASSVHDDFAFHSGAQGELQFNIGFEDDGFRHGVAFSFETSQSFPNIDELVKKVPLFNEYLLEHPSVFDGLQMWEWHEELGKRSAARLPQPLGLQSAKHGRFVFVGKITPLEDLNIDVVLADFDRLFGLYRHVESGGSAPVAHSPEASVSVGALIAASGTVTVPPSWVDGFKAGHTPYPELATATFSARTVDVRLRHNYLQSLIHPVLAREFGDENVGTEQRSASGGEIDFVIRRGSEWILAELKVSSLARWCIRDAVGQLLEYGYLKESNPPSELWVFGVGACTGEDEAYLEVLRSKLGVPLFYRQFNENKGNLSPRF